MYSPSKQIVRPWASVQALEIMQSPEIFLQTLDSSNLTGNFQSFEH